MKSQDAGLIWHLLLLILYIFLRIISFQAKVQRTRIIKQPYEKIEIRTVLLLNCALTFFTQLSSSLKFGHLVFIPPLSLQ